MNPENGLKYGRTNTVVNLVKRTFVADRYKASQIKFHGFKKHTFLPQTIDNDFTYLL